MPSIASTNHERSRHERRSRCTAPRAASGGSRPSRTGPPHQQLPQRWHIPAVPPTNGHPDLARREHAPAPAERLAALVSTPPTVSDAVKTLTAKGLIERRRDPSDARAAAVTLSQKGQEEAQRLVRPRPIWSKPCRLCLSKTSPRCCAARAA
ncbi:MarR family winged helix-turn-helix transcriptional regulator [Streptomyces sp900105245]|uniref:MarR family winged helix-turn-helix transcriptional regulator n=1 Tax=Streptomyces sp. 900105245 TaxID=3154379 RepID=A0ABV1UL14_9ACTN